ncbi:MAG: response regulator [Kiritimatiellae bacterium]|nr:response regulator [Kiritimatiellia bacterium]
MNPDDTSPPQEQNVIVVLADIADFIGIVREKGSVEAFEMLDEFYEMAGRAVERADGRVVKCIGDAALIVFPQNRLHQAVAALQQMRARAQTLWHTRGRECRIKVKAHAGPVAAGALGPARQKRFDVIGATVNELFLMRSTGDFDLSPHLQQLVAAADEAGAAAGTGDAPAEDAKRRRRPLTPRVVLVLDDEVVIRRTMEALLSRNGYEVVCAASAKEALERIEKLHVQVFFVDLEMPEMDGLALCKQMRRLKPIDQIYALTAYASVYDVVKCRDAGFDDYFVKPFDNAVILTATQKAFERLDRWQNP